MMRRDEQMLEESSPAVHHVERFTEKGLSNREILGDEGTPKTKTTSLLFIASSAHMHLFPFAINENLSFLLLTSKPETRLQLIVIAAIIILMTMITMPSTQCAGERGA